VDFDGDSPGRSKMKIPPEDDTAYTDGKGKSVIRGWSGGAAI
jgi:hypothetical protein